MKGSGRGLTVVLFLCLDGLRKTIKSLVLHACLLRFLIIPKNILLVLHDVSVYEYKDSYPRS
jgi:hypothetical protein